MRRACKEKMHSERRRAVALRPTTHHGAACIEEIRNQSTPQVDFGLWEFFAIPFGVGCPKLKLVIWMIFDKLSLHGRTFFMGGGPVCFPENTPQLTKNSESKIKVPYRVKKSSDRPRAKGAVDCPPCEKTAIFRRVGMSEQWRLAVSVGGFWLCSGRLDKKNPKIKSGASGLAFLSVASHLI